MQLTTGLGNVRRLALGKGTKGQALKRVYGAVGLDAHQPTRALEPVGVVVQVGVEPGHGVVGHAARLARNRRVVRVAHLHVVHLGKGRAPTIDLGLRHEQLAVVPAQPGNKRQSVSLAVRV